MHRDLKDNMQTKWKQNPKFSPFLDFNKSLSIEQQTKQENKVEKFNDTCLSFLVKHFSHCANELLPCALANHRAQSNVQNIC